MASDLFVNGPPAPDEIMCRVGPTIVVGKATGRGES